MLTKKLKIIHKKLTGNCDDKSRQSEDILILAFSINSFSSR